MNSNVLYKYDSNLTPVEALIELELMRISQDSRSEPELLEETLTIAPVESIEPAKDSLIDDLTNDIQEMVLSILKLEADEFSTTTPLMDYGLDSIAATEIGNLFTSRFNIVIPPTVFFEFQDLASFSNYVIENHSDELRALYPESPTNTADTPSVNIAKSTTLKSVNTDVVDNIPKQPKQTVAARTDQIDGSMAIEDLWEQVERTPEPEVSASPIPSNEPAVTQAQVRTLINEPSRAFVGEMKAYADLAHLHTITRAGKRQLEYATYGEGPPLLMLGGLVMHYNVMWLMNLKALGEHHQLIMFHMPGSGGVDLYQDMTLDTLADDIADVLDAQGITEPLPVFGCSFGGVLAQAFTLAYPQRCSALALTVSTPFSEGATDFQTLMKELQTSALFMEMNRGWPMANLPAYEHVIEGFDFREQLKSLNIPSLIISGGEDRYTTTEYSRMLADSLSGSQLVEFPDAGHLLIFSHHEQFNNLLLDFLATDKPQLAESASTEHGSSSFLPTTDNTLAIVQNYVENGQQGHSLMLSEHAAKLAMTLNEVCNQNKVKDALYRSYFLTSIEEALDAAIRLSRHQERNKNPKSSGKILLIDSNTRWSDYFDPMQQGQVDALVPAIERVNSLEQAEIRLRQEHVVAVAFVANNLTSTMMVDRFISTLSQYKALSILLETEAKEQKPSQWLSAQISQQPDLIVFGETMSGFQAPVAALLINESVTNPWLMTPSEGYVRQPMANFGLTVRLAFEYLETQFSESFSDKHYQAVRDISTDQQEIYLAHQQYGNVGYAKVANMHGFDARFYQAYGLRSRIEIKGEPSREIIDCQTNVGCAPRGLNPQDIIDAVVLEHEPQHDYWHELAQLLEEKTGFMHTLPCSSQTTAIESALTLAQMAAPERKKVLFFTGGAGFSMLSANSAKDVVFDLARKPFQPLYPHTVFIDPESGNAAQELEQELLSGELAFVWFETIQIEGNAVRPLPEHLIALINRHRLAGGYLVAVDETQTNLSSGKFLHSENMVESPDIVAIATALTDSLFPIGAVFTSNKVMQQAEKTNVARLRGLKTRSANQLSAHIALHSLQQIDSRNLMQGAQELGDYFKQSLQELAQSFPLICDVRGDGLLLAIEFDLTGYDAFVQQSFGYFLWGAMLRDQEFGVAVVVCPVHNRSIRLMPPLTITKAEIDIIVANLRRRMTEGVDTIFQNCSTYVQQRGYEKTASFLATVVSRRA